MTRRWNRQHATTSYDTASPAEDLCPIALVGVGANGEITSWNRVATVLLGWKATDVVGRRLRDLLGCADVPTPHADTRARVRAHVRAASGGRLEVEMLVDGGASSTLRYLASGEHMIAFVPVASAPTSETPASPRIDSWVDAAALVRELGGLVHCVAIGLVGMGEVNRGYSRSTGDAVLREVASRLRSCVGPVGHVVRVAGNQFVVVGAHDAGLNPERLVTLVSEPVGTPLGSIRIGCFAGSNIGDSISGLVLLDRADSAMRRAQVSGVGAVEYWSGDRANLGARHPRLGSLLLDAVARRDISVTFQPVVEMTTGRIIEFEALARWTSPEIGDVDPTAFITAAEDAGLIHELGQIVLERTLDVVQTEVLAGRWGLRRVSVNLSAVQLAHPDLPARVAKTLSERGLPGQLLQFELTESRLVPDIAAGAASLIELAKTGVRLALDDFGTGCANMAHLRDLPIDAIKIDGRFVANMCTSRIDTAVIRSLLSLATELHLDVIAEGVETAAQHVALTRLGCAAAQGFLYSGNRAPDYLYEAISLPERRQSSGFPYPLDETGRIEALHLADVLDTPDELVYDEIVRAAADLCATPVSLVSLIDEDRQWFKAKVGLDVAETPRAVAFCAHAICSEGLMEVVDAHEDDRFAENPLVVGEPHVRFYAGVPLRAAAGYSYGTLCVIDTVPRTLTQDQRDGLTRLAHQVTVLLELRGSINHLSHAYTQLEFAHKERHRVEARLRSQAQHDPLTGLPNRSLLAEIHAAGWPGDMSPLDTPFVLSIGDLDDFKLVNRGSATPPETNCW